MNGGNGSKRRVASLVRERQVLARLSPSAYDSLLTFSAPTGLDRQGPHRVDSGRPSTGLAAYQRGPIAVMLLGARDRRQPALAPAYPQLISGSEARGRIIKRADSNLDFVGAINNSKHRRPTPGAKMTMVGR
jgi:hypothetical protein